MKNDILRAQVATEFFLYSTIFMFIVIASFIIVSHIQSTEVPVKEYQLVKETAEGISGVITLAVKGGHGFAYKYTIQKTILGKKYITYLEPNSNPWLITEWSGQYGNFSYSYAIPSYKYRYKGCLCGSLNECTAKDGPVLVSDRCNAVLVLENDGETLTITQVK